MQWENVILGSTHSTVYEPEMEEMQVGWGVQMQVGGCRRVQVVGGLLLTAEKGQAAN